QSFEEAHQHALDAQGKDATAEVVSALKDYLNAPTKSWVDLNAPLLKDYTQVSVQFEQGPDRGLLDEVNRRYGEPTHPDKRPWITRYIAQMFMTGGLGALMHDLVVAWKKNGVDSISVNPLYNNNIKGVVDTSKLRLKPGQVLGDVFRDVLGKPIMSFSFPLGDDDAFRQGAQASKSRAIIGKEIHVNVHRRFTKVGGTPLYYLDAYYLDDGGNQVRVFDELYPDNDYRGVQMAIYNKASQRMLLELQKKGAVKKKIIFTENEVFVSLPKNLFPDAIRHHINHTVWKPGMYRPPTYFYGLMDFPEELRDLITRDGKIAIEEFAAITVDVLSGVGLYEHTPVLRKEVFPLYTHKIVGYNQGGLRSTNGALLDQWQGPEIRGLIDAYKKLLGMDPLVDDIQFYAALARNSVLSEEFSARFEALHALYALDLLIWLHDYQDQPLGGSTWLTDLLKGTSLDPAALRALRDEYRTGIEQALKDVGRWNAVLSELNAARPELSPLLEKVLRHPMAANVRRQVAYKGPDKYEELFQCFILADILRTNSRAIEQFEKLLAEDTEWLRADWNAIDPRLVALWKDLLNIQEGDSDEVIKDKVQRHNWDDTKAKLYVRLATVKENPNMLNEFRESGTRLILGGRTFGSDARHLFDLLKGMAKTLNLDNQVAFIENYNIEDAPTIFRGVSASVMMSDEFLEASATSMMKAVTNGAALIGVWGGAEPELFTIIETATGKEVDVFSPGVTHDLIAAGLKDGTYKIVNGFLVEYMRPEKLTGKAKELAMSREEMGGRRPDAQSLLQSFVTLGRMAANPVERRNLAYQTLASSPKVDIERSQARAHIKMWEAAIKARKAYDAFVQAMPVKVEEVSGALNLRGGGFGWKYKENGVTEVFLPIACEPGLVGFLKSFRRLRALGDRAVWSLMHHASPAYPQKVSGGDVFAYLDSLLEQTPTLKPLRDKLQEFGKAVAAADSPQAKVQITLAALDFVEQVVRRLQSPRAGLTRAPPAEAPWYRKNLLQIRVRSYGARKEGDTVVPGHLKNIRADLKKFKKDGFSTLYLLGLIAPSELSRKINRGEHDDPAQGLYISRDPATGQKVTVCRNMWGGDKTREGSLFSISDPKALNPQLGTLDDLKQLIDEAQPLGLKVIVDFVPNHMSVDSPLIREHLDWFIHRRLTPAEEKLPDEELLSRVPNYFIHYAKNGRRVLVAHGKDPNFDGWTDTAQLDYSNPELRAYMISVIKHWASLGVNGIRADMAMMILSNQIRGQWNRSMPEGYEFWREAVQSVKADYPDFFFLAETYWAKEGELLGLGIDATYDKYFLDILRRGDVEEIRNYLSRVPLDYLQRLAHFLENHDEQRAASTLGLPDGSLGKLRAALLLLVTAPGMPFIHDGQMDARQIFSPAQQVVIPDEKPNEKFRRYLSNML
ncbi:MAG TPA: alpha-amylase family glycosyl hydrolase, partial [Elusimicrobiota bacterium]|nr:alpha-amylase family glycosyl hydrolase [Elusimicrobiota bacterium]